jgi:ABC-2 type transport system permease protein
VNFHIYRVVLRSQVSTGRLLALVALSGVAILLAFVARAADDPVEFATRSMGTFGTNVFASFIALALASAALGNLVEDRTLVYLWLRPVPRYSIATAAYAAVLSVAGLLVVAVMSVAAAVSGVDDLLAATAVATALAMFAYSGIFMALGLRFKRSLLIGLGYIAIWELLMSRLGDWFARLSIRSYPMSILSDATGVSMRLADRSTLASYIVPLAVGLAGLAYTSWRLTRTEID